MTVYFSICAIAGLIIFIADKFIYWLIGQIADAPEKGGAR